MSLIDISATIETQALYTELQNAMGNYIYFGQDEFFEHIGTSNTNNDKKLIESYRITGKVPYILEITWNEASAQALNQAKYHNTCGGMLMVTWNYSNPVTGEDSHDKSGEPALNILPGGSKRTEHLSTLDLLATWCGNRKDNRGNLIPIIFRPFQECDALWYWWGIVNSNGGATNAQFISLWQDMVTYLRDTKGVHNLIYDYSPIHYPSPTVFADRYPGDDYVDIISVDAYDPDGEVSTVLDHYQRAYDEANVRGKVFGIAEGLRTLNDYPMSDYWTNGYMNQILADSKAKNAAFAQVWRTGKTGVQDRWGALYGSPDADSFLEMSNNPKVKFLLYWSSKIRNATLQNAEVR